jgi:hypothetical protein
MNGLKKAGILKALTEITISGGLGSIPLKKGKNSLPIIGQVFLQAKPGSTILKAANIIYTFLIKSSRI